VFTAVCAEKELVQRWRRIVANSNPAVESEQTPAKAAGFLAVLSCSSRREEALTGGSTAGVYI
jgi:hypothetical protein